MLTNLLETTEGVATDQWVRLKKLTKLLVGGRRMKRWKKEVGGVNNSLLKVWIFVGHLLVFMGRGGGGGRLYVVIH